MVLATVCFSCKQNQSASKMEWIGLSNDGKTLVEVSTGKPFLIWGLYVQSISKLIVFRYLHNKKEDER